MIRHLTTWTPALAWAGVLFYLSSRQIHDAPGLVVPDEVAHLALYAVLGTTLAWARVRAATPPAHWILLACGLLYALSDEFHQSFVPTRTPAVGDLLADAVGLGLGYASSLVLLGRTGTSRIHGSHD